MVVSNQCMFACNLCEDGNSDVVLAGLINKYGQLVRRQRPAEKHPDHPHANNIVQHFGVICTVNDYENSRSNGLLSGLRR